MTSDTAVTVAFATVMVLQAAVTVARVRLRRLQRELARR